MRIGRFANLMGKMEFDIKGEKIEIAPSMGDNRKLLKIMNNKDVPEDEKMALICDFISVLMIKSYPEESQDEIKQIVEFNMNDFMKEVLVGFGWTTRDKWDTLEGDASKKLMSGN